MRPLILFLSLITLNILGTPFTFYTSKSGLVHSDVHCVEQGEKFVWIGTSSGINRVLFKGTIPIQFSKRKTSVPVTALEDDGKVVWAGLKGKGVYQMLKENYKLIGFRKDVLGDKEIVNIKRVKKGLVVFTLSQKFSFDFGKERYSVVEYINPKYDPSIEIRGKILKINNGVLSRYNPVTKSFRSFSSFIEARDHLEWANGVLIASPKGLVFYNSEKDSIRFGPPKFELSEFQLNSKDTIPGDLDLSWGQHTLKYDFIFEELGAPNQINLVYVLNNGKERIENSVSALEGIEFRGLDHGSYVLDVIAKNEKGITSKNRLRYSFSIANPFMDSVWRYLIIIISIIVWTIIVVLITKIKFKKDRILLEDALLEKTNKLNQLEKAKYGLVDESEV